jgi:hypothetical protein
MSQRTIAAHCALPAVQLTARVKRCETVRGRRGERPARRPDERERQQATPAFDRAVAGRHRWRLHRPLRLLARTSTVEPFAMRAVASVPWGADDASAPLATAARASAVSGRAAAARKVLNLLRVMLAPWLGRNSVALGALRQWPGPRSRYWLAVALSSSAPRTLFTRAWVVQRLTAYTGRDMSEASTRQTAVLWPVLEPLEAPENSAKVARRTRGLQSIEVRG